MGDPNDLQNQGSGSEIWISQAETSPHDHRRRMAEFTGDGGIARDEPIGTDRAVLAGDAPLGQRRVRPQTHGGTLRCLIEDVRSQRKAISRKISRHQEDIIEFQEEMFRQTQREKILTELLDNWQRTVEELTESGG